MNAVIQRLSLRRRPRRQKTTTPPLVPPPPPSRPGGSSAAPGGASAPANETVVTQNVTSSGSSYSGSSSNSSGNHSLYDKEGWMKNTTSFDMEDHDTERGPMPESVRTRSSHRRNRNSKKKKAQDPSTPEIESHHPQQVDLIARAAAALDNAGNELFEKGDYDKAMASYVRALKLKRRSLQMAERSQADGNCQHLDGDSDSQRSSFSARRESLTSQSKGHEFLLASVATSINNIGYLRQRTGEATAEESLACYQDALRIKQEVLGHDNLSFGKTLNNLASVHYLKKEFDLAIDSYRKALYILEGHLGTHHLDVGTVYSNLGDVYWAQRNGPLAVENYRRALEIRWLHLGEHDPKVVRLLEKIALIELKETSLNLDDSATGPDGGYHDTDDDDDKDPTAPSRLLVQLHDQVEQDMSYVDDMKRKMAVLMVKDRLRVLRDMKNMDTSSGAGSSEDDAESILAASWASNRPSSSSTSMPHHDSAQSLKTQSFSPMERMQALDAVKQRLAKLRASRSDSTRSFTSTTPELIRTTTTQSAVTTECIIIEDDGDDKESTTINAINTATTATYSEDEHDDEKDDTIVALRSPMSDHARHFERNVVFCSGIDELRNLPSPSTA